ncbi:hypothetical protein [Arthrobacter sp. CAN_A1]|uniref:hypothetical protein n=1 Tax=Arthrobacter sp. CAN_A1 TaxID=2787717 RepID=UPI0018CBC79D
MSAEHNANLRADQSLLTATGVGACLSVLHIFVWPDSTLPWVRGLTVGPADPWLWLAAPTVLLWGAYLFVATAEGREGRRGHRGAMAVLVVLAVVVALFSHGIYFSPIYGLALLLLAVRTRGVLSTAVGVFALLVALGILSLQSSGAALSVSLLAVASLIAAVRIRHDRRNQAEDCARMSA